MYNVLAGIWAILAAPLLVSADLRNIDQEIKEKVYFNDEVIAVNQDPLGIQGKRVISKNKQEVISIPHLL